MVNSVYRSHCTEKMQITSVGSDTDLIDEFREDSALIDTNQKIVGLEKSYKPEILWRRVVKFGSAHIMALYGIYLLPSAKIATTLFGFLLYMLSILGITAGAHRLWSHRSYKAKWPLRLLLAFMYTICSQFSIINWVRDHRMHHKYSDTDADPYNAARGFFFSHIGWLLHVKHPDLKEKGKGLDVSDLHADPILRYQDKYNVTLTVLICVLIPTIVPVYCWNESWKHAFFICYLLRFAVSLNATCLVNSAAHLYGMKPFDKSMYARQNAFVSYIVLGEGWHNYHHAFPWDYRAAEFGSGAELTNTFIESFAKIGWAYDLKSASSENIKKRAQRTGDGSYKMRNYEEF